MRAKTRENAPKTPPVWLPVDYPILPSTPCLLPCSARCPISGGWSTRHPASTVPVEVPVIPPAGRGQPAGPRGRRNLSAYERTKLALGRRYNRTKKARGGDYASEKAIAQNEPKLNTAANLAAEHSALRLVEVPAMPSRIHATGFERIVRHLVGVTGRNARESPPARRRKRSCP